MLKPKSINAIRDLAVEVESEDIKAAHALMEIAYSARPDGPFIKKKLHHYKQKIDHIQRLLELQRAGIAAVIPIGFRCYTAQLLKRQFGISQQTYPFNNGFFPPASFASLLTLPRVCMNTEDKTSFDICQKFENQSDPTIGKGIRFIRSSKEEIDAAATSRQQKGINQYLDSTYGYYTLDNQHSYVLAHYNWHAFADERKSKGVIDTSQNLKIVCETLNRRMARLLEICHAAKIIIFVYHNPQNYKYMSIDNKMLDLCDLSKAREAATAVFKEKAHVVTGTEVVNSSWLRERVAHEVL